jgi:uncharacterized membrane protein
MAYVARKFVSDPSFGKLGNENVMYAIDNLGTWPGSTVEPADISSDGRVVGTLRGPANASQAFVWDPWKGIQPLPSQLNGRQVSSEARAINAAGVIVGAFVTELQAVRWDNQVLTVLTNPPTAVGSFTHDVNNDGVAVGGYIVPGPQEFPSVWYTPTSVKATNPGGPPPSWSEFLGINNLSDPEVVGDGFLWTASGFIPLPGAHNAINDYGVIVGTYGSRAGRWKGLSLDLLELLQSFDSSEADDINNRGEVVGYCGQFLNFTRACIWNRWIPIPMSPIGGTLLGIPIPIISIGPPSQVPAVEDLNSLIDGALGWDLQRAVAINNSGQITGWGTHNGEMAAYRLTPPPENVFSPGWALVAAVITILVGGRLGDPGLGLGPQGPVPIPPRGPERDLLLATWILEIANQIESPVTRNALRRVALEQVIREATRLLEHPEG